MDTSALSELLASKLGIDAESMGPSFLSSLARRILPQPSSAELQSFVRKAANGGECWQKVVENAVVSESWFFRDGEPFDHIVETVRQKWHGTRAVRVLSCPCSTGEEPYSVAIALSEAGLPPESFAIVAADINASALKTAQTGVFKARAFRGSHRVDRAQYFQHDAATQRWRVKQAFRSMIHFQPANLVSLQGLENAGLYDIVLCRNLLIYLHAKARDSVMASLRRLLTDDGVLIVGHAEPAIAREHGFTGIGEPGAFAFAKAGAPKSHKATSRTRADRFARTEKLSRSAGVPSLKGSQTPEIGVAGKAVRLVQAEPSLQRIRQLGDQGRVAEAIQACRDYVRRVPDSADGYFLLGVLRGAVQEDEAAEAALRRALYLEPEHVGARMHLTLLHDARRNNLAAGPMRARASRERQS